MAADVTASLTTDICTEVDITGGGMDAAISGTIDATDCGGGGGADEAVCEWGGGDITCPPFISGGGRPAPAPSCPLSRYDSWALSFTWGLF